MSQLTIIFFFEFVSIQIEVFFYFLYNPSEKYRQSLFGGVFIIYNQRARGLLKLQSRRRRP